MSQGCSESQAQAIRQLLEVLVNALFGSSSEAQSQDLRRVKRPSSLVCEDIVQRVLAQGSGVGADPEAVRQVLGIFVEALFANGGSTVQRAQQSTQESAQ